MQREKHTQSEIEIEAYITVLTLKYPKSMTYKSYCMACFW